MFSGIKLFSFYILIICLVILNLSFGSYGNSRANKFVSSQKCSNYTKCSQCIRSPKCTWCKDPRFSETESINKNYARCNTYENHKLLGLCNENFLESSQNEIETEEYEDFDTSKVQLWPQVFNIKLGVGKKVNVTLSYYDTKNKPLDLYYIMDLSATMANDKPKVATLGTKLAHRIQNLTSNVRIGFGSFIEKPINPFIAEKKLDGRYETENTTSPYGFKSHLALTENIDAFQEEVKRAKTSGNLDEPECGLDAIIQAAACTDIIGWRKDARHLLILSTDGPFHIAGDGKLAGILKPNDGKCHMIKDSKDENSNVYVYTEDTKMDYPSISQVNQKVREKNIFVIFAVTEENVKLYERLSARIQGSGSSALKDDSDNVVELVEAEYKKIISSVEIPKFPSHITKFLKVNYYAKCDDGPFVKGNKCSNLKIGANATFEIEFELTHCPKQKKDWKQSTLISPVGLLDKVQINLEMLCECNCENEIESDNVTLSTEICNRNGTLQCGICKCNKGFFGKNCQCASDSDEVDSSEMQMDTSGCRYGNSTELCSNRGTCLCGECTCSLSHQGHKMYSGPYCECNDFNCPLGANGLSCSGNGECKCSKCVCDNDWSGEVCDCPVQENECKETDDMVCNNHGTCVCGKCVCETSYVGKFCQNCPSNYCPGRCDDPNLYGCIRCHIENLQYWTRDTLSCDVKCANFTTIEDAAQVFEENDDEKTCTIQNEDECEATWIYSYDRGEKYMYKAKFERKFRCKSHVPLTYIISSVIGSIIIGGIILIFCWKYAMYFYDKREMKKFQENIKDAKWNKVNNPIYREASSNYNNPVYATTIRT